MIEFPDLEVFSRAINCHDILRVSSIKSFVATYPELPEFSEDCLIVVRGANGIEIKERDD